MSCPLRLLDTGLMPARWNVAMTATLIERHARRQIPDTLRLHRYHTSVLLGAGQQADEAADLDHCRLSGIDIARRVTGGGAVFMAPEMLAWDLIVDRARLGGHRAVVTARLCSGIARGLSRLGVDARFRPPNDIVIGRHKVSGSSGYASGRSVALQGTVMIGNDLPTMAAALRIPLAELRSRVTCLNNHVSGELDAANVSQCVVSGLIEALEDEFIRSSPTDDEIGDCETLLRNEIGLDEFVLGKAGPAGLEANA